MQALKIFLRDRGYYTGAIDDVMTLEVLKSFRRYQYDRGLNQTGRNDLRTRMQIIAELS